MMLISKIVGVFLTAGVRAWNFGVAVCYARPINRNFTGKNDSVFLFGDVRLYFMFAGVEIPLQPADTRSLSIHCLYFVRVGNLSVRIAWNWAGNLIGDEKSVPRRADLSDFDFVRDIFRNARAESDEKAGGVIEKLLRISPDFEGKIMSERAGKLQIITDGRNTLTAAVARGYLRRIMDDFSGAKNFGSKPLLGSIRTR